MNFIPCNYRGGFQTTCPKENFENTNRFFINLSLFDIDFVLCVVRSSFKVRCVPLIQRNVFGTYNISRTCFEIFLKVSKVASYPEKMTDHYSTVIYKETFFSFFRGTFYVCFNIFTSTCRMTLILVFSRITLSSENVLDTYNVSLR